MKKSITVLLSVFLVIFLLYIIYVQFFKKENTEHEIEQGPKQTKIEKLSHLLSTGEIDYQYYYKYDRSFGCTYYLKDEHVYYMLKSVESTPIIVEMINADIETLKVFDFLYAKDKNFAYYLGNILEGADPATFEGVYSGNANGCPGEVDGPSFATGFAKDKNHNYKYGKVIN